MTKKEDDRFWLGGEKSAADRTVPAAGAGSLTADLMMSQIRKMENLLKEPSPPYSITGSHAVSLEKNPNRFGSPSPRLTSFLKNPDTRMIGRDTSLKRGPGDLINIIESPFLTKKEQFFFPKTKKKRIQKKAAKKYVHEIPDLETVYFVNENTIFCHPQGPGWIRQKNHDRY